MLLISPVFVQVHIDDAKLAHVPFPFTTDSLAGTTAEPLTSLLSRLGSVRLARLLFVTDAC